MHCWFVPNLEPEKVSGLSYVFLRETCLCQRAPYPSLLSRKKSGSGISKIIKLGSIKNRLKSGTVSLASQFAIECVLAVIASVRGVRRVACVMNFIGGYNNVSDADASSSFLRDFDLSRGEGFGDGCYSGYSISQRLACKSCDQ